MYHFLFEYKPQHPFLEVEYGRVQAFHPCYGNDFNPLSPVHVNVCEKSVSTERTPYTYVWNTLVTICCAVCSAFTGNFCWLCQVIPQAMVRECHVEKSKRSIKVALWACWTQLLFESVLRILNFITLYFCGEHWQDAQRILRRQRGTWACALVTRDAADEAVFWQRKWESWRSNWNTHWQRWSWFCWYARHCWSPGYNGLILCCQTHVHAVKNTNVDVMAGGDSERCEKFDCFENWCWENSWLQKLKSGFEAISHFYSTFLSVFHLHLMLSFP